MSAVVGQSAVLLGFLASLGGALTLVAGLLRRRPALLRLGRSYVWVVLGAAVVAVLVMERALVTHDFSLTYVAENHSRSTPLIYTIASLWGALEGSILLWALVLAGYLAIMVHRFRHRTTDPLVAWATVTVLLVAVFFFGLMLGPANPFQAVAGAIP
ncbi:MAG: heme lyase CcmF/NrfE family subunit, partial [Acidimicrobiales bacterium]